MSKLEDNKEKKKAALFSAALELFTVKGFEKTTISDIAEKAGIAKGTFYLYFEDKYDLRNRLAAYQVRKLFYQAYEALEASELSDFKNQLIFLINHILQELSENPFLLTFVSQNLTWSTFRNFFEERIDEEDSDFYEFFQSFLEQSRRYYRYPEFMLFTVVELVWSTCYSCILFGQPAALKDYKPHLYRSIESIMQSFRLENMERA